jgi:uncharacterized protein YbbC (DUF1343 family)
MSYTKYFNGKYGRKGRMGEKGTYVLRVNGFNHQLVLNNYIFRNGLHHCAAATAFGYPYSSIQEMFAADLGQVLPPAVYTKRSDIASFLPRFADFPDSYVMDGSGVFLRRSFMEIRQVEMFYSSARNFLYQMNRLTDETWEEEQKKDGTGKPDRETAYAPGGDALDNVDVLVFDMQDVGSRYFTYVSSMFYCMRTCGERGMPFVVLDRPNPLGGDVEGNVLDPAYSSFIGLTEVPIRHGLTTGELASFYNDRYGLGCDLTVVPMTGWNRDMYWDDTGLPFVRPSPNLPTFESVLVYNGTCLFEGTNASTGRGTTVPFTTIGAEYIRPLELCDTLNADPTLEGVRFSPAFFEPLFSKLCGKALYGVTIHVTDKRALRAVRLGVTMLRTIEKMYPEFEYTAPSVEGGRWHIDLASGGTELRTSGKSAAELIGDWDRQSAAFSAQTEQYRLYE